LIVSIDFRATKQKKIEKKNCDRKVDRELCLLEKKRNEDQNLNKVE